MFDLVFITILFLLSIAGFFKGFVKSTFSFLNWILALLITYFISPILAPFFPEEYSGVASNTVISAFIFIVCVIVIPFITRDTAKTLANAISKPIDKSLGFAFGFFKAYIIVSIFFFAIGAVYNNNLINLPNQSQDQNGNSGPNWLIEAKSYKILQLGSNILKPLVNKVSNRIFGSNSEDRIENGIKNEMEKNLDNKIKEINNIDILNGDIYENLDKLDEKGYHKKEIEKMDRLIEALE